MTGRIVCQFSCGAASAVATKLVLGEYGISHDVHIINAYLKEEHEDNRRFLRDCEAWFGQKVIVLQDTKYNASTREVFRRRRYMKGLKGAPCSQELKRKVLDAYRQPGDTVVLGYTADPLDVDRYNNWIDAHPNENLIAPLVDRGLKKADVLAMVERAGLRMPHLYTLGYQNANCIGCVKGGAGYWNKIRRDFPDDFEEMAQIEELIGPGAKLLRHRSGPLKGQRFYLRELDPNSGRYEDEPDISCSASCELAENSGAWSDLREFWEDPEQADLQKAVAKLIRDEARQLVRESGEDPDLW